MFSGKTTELQNVKSRFQHANKNVLLFNPRKNTRDSELVRSHDGQTAEALLFGSKAELLAAVDRAKPDVVLIEEAQFVPYIAEVCDALYDRQIHVFMAALNETSEGRPWPCIRDLLHTCEVHQTWAVCRDCASMHACHSGCIATVAPDEDGFLPGGESEYKALCTPCFKAHLKNGSRQNEQ
jgi:thymidine kinase